MPCKILFADIKPIVTSPWRSNYAVFVDSKDAFGSASRNLGLSNLADVKVSAFAQFNSSHTSEEQDTIDNGISELAAFFQTAGVT